MTKRYSLCYYGDPILRKRSKLIEEITEEINDLTHQMIEIMDKHNGCGLSAIQVGVPVRLFVLRNYVTLPDGYLELTDPVVYINPKIILKSKETNTDTEGCLSIPKRHWGPVERPNKITIEALDLEGNRFVDEREGLNARVTFHENDHLNGVLFIDRLPPKVRKKIEPELQEIKKQYFST